MDHHRPGARGAGGGAGGVHTSSRYAVMDESCRAALQQQFGAAIEMLERALLACPEERWDAAGEHPRFWYLVYHALFFLDYYLSDPVPGFVPPAPFTLSELDPAGALPERVYGRDELRRYLEHGRTKSRAVIGSLTAERARETRSYGSISASAYEIQLYNLRHLQHHVGQLYLLLRQRTGSAPAWVARA